MSERYLTNKGLSLDRLRSLLEVAEAGGPSKAAKGDSSKQSQYSRQLSELEKYFGVQLKKPSGRGMECTPAGKRLIGLARACFVSFQNFYDEEKAKPQEFVIAAHQSELSWILMPRLKNLMASLEGLPVTFEVRNLRTEEIVEQIKDFRVHFGILREDVVPSGFQSARAGTYGYSLYVPKDLMKGKKARNWKNVIGKMPLATMVSTGQFTTDLMNAAAQNKIDLIVDLKCNSFAMAAAALREGTHAAIIPDIALR